METTDKKRKYVKPAMQVVELQHRTMILADSGGTPGSRSPYGDPTTDDWD